MCWPEQVTDGSGIPTDARVMIIGDAAALRAFELLKQSVGDCRDVLVMKSQAEKYPNADLGLPAESAAHFKCARGIQLWFHGFTIADQARYSKCTVASAQSSSRTNRAPCVWNDHRARPL